MPLDTALMLAATRSPQVDTPQEYAAKQLQLGSMFNQQKVQNLELKKAQRAEDDDKALRDTYAANTATGADGMPNVNYSKTMADLFQSGHAGQAISVGNAMRAQKMAETEAQLKQLELTTKKSARLGEIAQTITDDPSYQTGHRQMLQEGLLTSDLQQQLPQVFTPDLMPHIKQLAGQALSAKDYAAAEAQKLTDAALVGKNDAEKKEFLARATKTTEETTKQWIDTVANQMGLAKTPEEYSAKRSQLAAMGAPPEVLGIAPLEFSLQTAEQLQRAAMDAKGRAELDRQVKADANNVTNQNAMRGFEAKRVGLEGQRVALERDRNNVAKVAADPFGQFGLNPNPPGGAPQPGQQPKTGMEFLGTLPPAMANRVQAIASGAVQGYTGRAAASGPGAQMMAAVQQYDHSWTEQRAKTRSSFTTGKQGDNIGALNTATVHLDQLAEAAKEMKNGTFRPGNDAYNRLAAAFGASAVTNFDTLKSAVAGEMATALKGNATDQEIHEISKNIQNSNSPDQLAGFAQTSLHTLGAKLNTYDERYHAISSADDPWTPVLPSARAVYQKYGINPVQRMQQPGAGQGNQQQYKVGDTVLYNGAPHKITDIKNGKLVLEN